MKRRYDFSTGVRGKFHNPDAVFRLPVYLDKKVEIYLAAKAAAKGIELSDLVNDLLNKEIEIFLPRLFRSSHEANPFHKQAFAFMSIACLALSMFTGYITRPIPIDQLTTKAQTTTPSP